VKALRYRASSAQTHGYAMDVTYRGHLVAEVYKPDPDEWGWVVWLAPGGAATDGIEGVYGTEPEARRAVRRWAEAFDLDTWIALRAGAK
jgi:hypothetical protein